MIVTTILLGLLGACSTSEVNAPVAPPPPSTATGVAAPTAAPQVVSTVPAEGAVVPPGLTWISVTFNQDMDTRGFSFTGDPSRFPPVQGQPEWLDSRTARFQSVLAPDRSYAFGVNGPGYSNFRSASGVPAEGGSVRFSTQAEGGSAVDSAAMAERLIELMRTQYSHRALREVDWAAWEDQTRRDLAGGRSACEVARSAGQRLAVLEDGHIWLTCQGQTLPSYAVSPERNVALDRVRALVPDLTQISEQVAYGHFGRQGYLLVGSWVGEPADLQASVDQALFKLADAEGLILDVRANGGGDERQAQYLAGHFVSQSTPYAKHRSIGMGESVRVLEPTAPRVSGPVALLQGPASMSSNEAFVLMMRAAGARSFGANTAGSSGNPKAHDLGAGVAVYLPSWQAMTLDGTPFEGQGLAPDERVPWGAEGDPVLEAAQAWLLTH